MNVRTRLTFISHAPTRATRRAAFPLDEPIEDAARKKICGIQLGAENQRRILCGPEKRTQETAIALGLSATIDQALRDCNCGSWAGRELNELQLENPNEVALWLSDPQAAPHGGESIKDLIARVMGWLAEQTKSSHTVAITSSAVIRAAIVSALEIPPKSFWRIDIVPLTLTDLRFNGTSWNVRCTGTPLAIGICD